MSGTPKKVIKSFSVDPDVAAYLEGTGNASGTVTKLVRRQMLSERVDQLVGQAPSSSERKRAREWARAELDAANDAVRGGAYDDIRRQMGWA